MSQKYTEGFKIQAVEKALSRSIETTLTEIAETLGVSRSALSRWITQSKSNLLETDSDNATHLSTMKEKEKRPQDWTAEARFELIMESTGLKEKEISELCRTRGLFPHHIEEWKQQFISVTDQSTGNEKQVTVKALRNEIKALNKDLNRKNKALAETAALLVLQKKVNTIWGNNEAN
jgi:transposase-like protein